MSDPYLVIVTGMSGAGRSVTANVLEDNDFFVVDNLPLRLIPNVVDDHRQGAAVDMSVRRQHRHAWRQ